MRIIRSSCLATLLSVIICGPASGQSEQYNLTGVTAYDPAELLGFAAGIVAQRTGSVHSDDLAQTVEVIYREDGHFLAEVFVSKDGRTLVVDEGEIGEIAIEGADARAFRLIKSYMLPVVGRRGVTQREFERALMLVEDIESISASAEIDYPDGASTARVRIHVQEIDRSFGYVTLDNPSREFGEAATLTFNQSFLSALTPGDLLRFELQGTAEFDGGDDTLWGSVVYRMPLGGSGAFGEVYLGNATARRDAEGALLATDIEGNTAIVALGYPVLRDVDTYGYGILEYRRSSSDVDVGGTEFDSDVDVLGASWIFGKALPRGGAYEYALNASFGHRGSDAISFDDGDEDFFHLRFGFGYEHPVKLLGPETTVRAEFWAQHSNDRLPRIEEFHVGGREEERGYVFAEAQGDSGVSATFEVSRDLFPEAGMLRRIRPFGFLDVGYVENNDPAPDEVEDETFASLGLGVDAELSSGFFVRSYLAAPLTDGPSTDSGDPAFYLALTKSW